MVEGNKIIIKIILRIIVNRARKEILRRVSTLVFILRVFQYTQEDFILAELVNVSGKALIILRSLLTVLIIYASFSIQSRTIFNILLKTTLAILVLSFSVESLIRFYYYFESVLIPIFILILGWGYQPERFRSALFILFYTLLLSLPLLVVIISIGRDRGSTFIPRSRMYSKEVSSYFRFALIGAFLVKFPIFLRHLWLPKAHVEAPVAGSIILAGVLLKLGGYGLLLVYVLVQNRCSIWLLVSTAIIGGGILALRIIRILDLKVAIAYSSVVHIGIVIAVFLGIRRIGFVGGLLIMVAHGLTSSGIFRAANIMYERGHSRSMSVNKGLLSRIRRFTVFWFLLCVINFAGPFTLNLLAEIIIIQAVIAVSVVVSLPVFLLCFFSAAYNLNLYATSQQGCGITSESSKHCLNFRENLVLFSHASPCVIILLRLRLLTNSNIIVRSLCNAEELLAWSNNKI